MSCRESGSLGIEHQDLSVNSVYFDFLLGNQLLDLREGTIDFGDGGQRKRITLLGIGQGQVGSSRGRLGRKADVAVEATKGSGEHKEWI